MSDQEPVETLWPGAPLRSGTASRGCRPLAHSPDTTALSFHIYHDPGSGIPTPIREKEILGVPLFTPRTGRLTVFDKARGVGDCGIYSTFRRSGARFIPVETNAKTRCDGKPPYDPQRWPKLPCSARGYSPAWGSKTSAATVSGLSPAARP